MKTWIRGIALAIFFLPLLTHAASVKDMISDKEQELEVTEKDMYTMIYADDLVRELEKVCEPYLISSAQELAEQLRDHFATQYTAAGDAEVLVDSWELYEKIREIQPGLDAFDEDTYCKAKLIFYQMQNWLREVNLQLLKEHELDNDFGEFNLESLNGIRIKLDLLDNKIEEYAPYKKKLGQTVSTRFSSRSYEKNMTPNEKELLERIEDLFTNMIYFTLYDLIEEDILTEDDVEILEDVVIYTVEESCSLFHGNYEIRETLDNKGNHIEYETLALNLKLNYCPNFFILRDLDVVLHELLVHEIGHHIYYYADKKSDEFEDICRSDGDTRKQKCSADGFVSEYAKSYAVEDYADHFMHWYLYPEQAHASEILREKSDHFDRLLR